MPTRFERWIRSKLWAITARTPSSRVPLAAQSRLEPEPYSLPASTTSGHALIQVANRGVVDRHLLAVREMKRHTTFRTRGQLVSEADVGERPAHHHLVVATPRAVGVERLGLRRRCSIRYRPAGLSRLIEPAGDDVVGGDAVAEHREHAGALDVGDRRGLGRQLLEERGPAHIGGIGIPREASPVGTSSEFQRSSPSNTSP